MKSGLFLRGLSFFIVTSKEFSQMILLEHVFLTPYTGIFCIHKRKTSDIAEVRQKKLVMKRNL